jgi:predicted metal-dependent phosphoesterase TrpH
LQLKIDLHVHSYYSIDSSITPEELVFYARRCGLDGVAVTDHDRLDGAVRIAKETDFLIVPGIEITSADGHVVGLNLQESIPRGLSVDQTVDLIHESGGIAIACHPVGLFKGGLGKFTSSRFDAVEVMNSSAIPFGYTVRQNERIASHLGKARVAGSDAHYGPEIGYAYTLVDAEVSADGVVNAISKGLCQPFGRAIPMTMRLKRMFAVRTKRFQF